MAVEMYTVNPVLAGSVMALAPAAAHYFEGEKAALPDVAVGGDAGEPLEVLDR
jgi:hypothetical protein